MCSQCLCHVRPLFFSCLLLMVLAKDISAWRLSSWFLVSGWHFYTFSFVITTVVIVTINCYCKLFAFDEIVKLFCTTQFMSLCHIVYLLLEHMFRVDTNADDICLCCVFLPAMPGISQNAVCIYVVNLCCQRAMAGILSNLNKMWKLCKMAYLDSVFPRICFK